MLNLDRFAELFAMQKRNYVYRDGVLFLIENNTLRQFGPIINHRIHSDDLIRSIMKETGALISVSQEETNIETDKPSWYSVICRKGLTIEEYPDLKIRNRIRRSLKRCKVSKVTASEIAPSAYEVMEAAMKEQYYKTGSLGDKKSFTQKFLLFDQFSDIVDLWGIFVNDELAGIAQNYIFGKVESNYSYIKFIPEKLSYCSSYGLFYTMGLHYLENEGFAMVNDGFRNIYHDTTVQEVLLKNFEFEKLPLKLNIQHKYPIGGLLSLLSPFSELLTRLDPRMGGLVKLQNAYSEDRKRRKR